MSTALLSLVLLTAVYLMVVESFSVWDVLFGGVVSGLVLLLVRQRPAQRVSAAGPGLGRRIVRFVPFAVAVFFDILAGTWDVLLTVLHLRSADRAGFVEVPIGERTPTGVAVTSLLITLSPGSVVLDIDHERGIMLYHVLDATNPDDVRARYQRFYERFQRHVFP